MFETKPKSLLQLEVKANWDGWPVRLTWDSDSQGYSGMDADGEAILILWWKVQGMLPDPIYYTFLAL